MDVSSERVIKLFERLHVFYQTGDKVIRTDGCFYQTGEQVVRTDECFYQTGDQVVRTDANFFERTTQVVQTDANLFRTASKRLVNGIPFKNGKPLVYVFA